MRDELRFAEAGGRSTRTHARTHAHTHARTHACTHAHTHARPFLVRHLFDGEREGEWREWEGGMLLDMCVLAQTR